MSARLGFLAHRNFVNGGEDFPRIQRCVLVNLCAAVLTHQEQTGRAIGLYAKCALVSKVEPPRYY